MTTIFLADAKTLRISFPYLPASVAAIKQIDGARWNPESRTWRVPLDRLDAVLSIFGDSAAVAPEVFMAADATPQEILAPSAPLTPEQRLENFMLTLVWAGVTLSINGAQVLGSGGAWTQILQAEIDKRATQLIRLLRSGWQPPVPMAVRPAPVPENYDLITDFDRGAAKWEKGWLDKQAKVEGYKAAAQRRRWHSDKGEQMGMFEQEGL
jgi:hypothetical protein